MHLLTCEHLLHGLELLQKRRKQLQKLENHEHSHGPGERETNLKMLLHQLNFGCEVEVLHGGWGRLSIQPGSWPEPLRRFWA